MDRPKLNFIGGDWIEGIDVGRNINPSDTDDLVGLFTQASVDQVKSATAAARSAFPAWSRSGIQVRHDLLKRVGDELMSRKDELGRLLSREEGKILSEGVAEVVRAAQIFLFFSGECLRLDGERGMSVRAGIDVEISREPIGVVGIIAPWNFPMAIPAWKIAPALAFGNCVLFKPADLVSASAHALSAIIASAGVPAGVFNLLMGRGSIVGQAMIDSPEVDAISFTGSVETGRRVATACIGSAPMKKLQLEMGGKNPLVVLDDADLDVAVDCALSGAFFSTGQRCTASSRLIVTEGIHDRFVSQLVERMKALVVDDALKAATQIGPVVDQHQLEQDLAYIRLGEEEGARRVTGGEVLQRATKGFFLAPALFTEASATMRVAREEIFGPVATVIKTANYDEALHVANETEFGLSSGICTTSLKHATHFKRNSEAGMVMVNAATAGVDYHVPFGGRKSSSFGSREQGRYAREFFTVVKTTYTDSLAGRP